MPAFVASAPKYRQRGLGTLHRALALHLEHRRYGGTAIQDVGSAARDVPDGDRVDVR